MTEADSPAIWVLTDDRPGNNAQALGVAEALGLPFQERAIRYTGWARLPNILRGPSLAGLTDASRAVLTPPWPDVLIAAGRRAAPVARWVKAQAKGHTVLTQIMDPGRAGSGDFDVIAVPTHDARVSQDTRRNVLLIDGAPHRITPDLLRSEATRWKDRFDGLPRPYVALIVGGATRRRSFALPLVETLAERVSRLAKAANGSVLVTTSRRTGGEAERVIDAVIPEPRFLHTWNRDGENPYLGLLALADAVVVTGDSVTMCSEACATPGPVYIFAPPGSVSAKHARLHEKLYNLGVAKPFRESLETWTHPQLNPAGQIADAVRQVLSTRGK